MSLKSEEMFRLAFSSNGVDYAHFHDGCDPNFKCDEEFESILKRGSRLSDIMGRWQNGLIMIC